MTTEDRFRNTMDSITRSGNSSGLAELVRHAGVLFAALDGHAMADAPEAFRAALYAAAATTHLDTLAALAWRAGQLWDDPDDTSDNPRAAIVACLREHATHPAVTAASAAARNAGIPLAVFRHDWRNAYGEHGAQGLYFAPTGPRSVEFTWYIDGRDSESTVSRARVNRVRAARNTALDEVHTALAAAGWSVWVKASSNTHTKRLLSILATLPR